ncbi:bifunctional diguanylate cyclase/phosphodiesterase [Rhodococcus sp. SORGH_AS_0303]|uniref:putative bifunctional diguanylate cyclase/phosphodiesterase n=1 Tax=Rhodococcus sp. SORGH_AS_0303 TaxID=3041753 RepID=UPI00277DFEF6|nr:GGDEF and EAL domain-containing protein [Rhodococcus sp. SORGH_AS_0303]MDQ1199433.1 diguanylate cyclase (GGDEF)-like protein [Rhodococcus sp. SORGH_AS_0303]
MALDGLDPALLTGVFENAPELVSLSALDGRILHLNPAGLALVGAPSLDAVLRLTTANFFSDVGLLAAPDVERSLHTTGHWQGVGELRRLDTGEPVPVSISTFLVPAGERDEPVIASIMRDRRLRTSHESALTDVLESAAHRAREQSAVGLLGRLAVDGDLTTILDATTSAASSLMGTECASIARLDDTHTALRVVAYSGVSERTESRFDTTTMRSRGLLSTVCVPFDSTPRPGVLAVHSAAPREYTDRDVTFLRTATDILVAAIRRIELENELRYRSLHDPLTGLANRALAYRRIDEAVARAADSETTVAVLLADLDDFTTVNDSLGHVSGDAALITLARKLERTVAVGDTVARLGGDEFLVVCDHVVDEADARSRAVRISTALATVDPQSDQPIPFSASIGFAVAGDDAPSAQEMVRRADLAMYRAKGTAPGTTDVYDVRDRYEADRVFRLAADLRRSLVDGELRLVYQPIVDLVTGAVVAAEALARWDHPTLGSVSPREFVAVAERTGVVGHLGLWALQTACTDAVRWPEDVSVRVNVSAHQLNDPDFVQSVRRTLDATGLPATRLGLEITETVWVKENARVATTLEALHAMGVSFALDDLGTGHSSIAYLDRYPIFDCLEIDGSYVNALPGARPHAIVAAIVLLGTAFGVDVVGEGIETAEQAEAYRACGGRLAQGFHLARPMPAAAIEQLLREGVRSPR